MSTVVVWYLILGIVLLVVAVSSSYIEKMPVTTSIIYFLLGIFLGPSGVHLLEVDLLRDAKLFETVTELVVVISLFVAGLKLRHPFTRKHWDPTWRLAFVSMTFTVLFIALFSFLFLKIPMGAAFLIGAILAPTDPVLASGVQVKNPDDRDQLRFALTGEAGLNDGTAFPFVMLGLGLLGLHEIGAGGIRWIGIDVVWAIGGGLGCGWLLGTQVSKFVVHLRKKNEETIIIDDFLAIGLIAMSYGFAQVIHTYGFLAVFAAGLAMRKIEEQPKPETIKSSHHEAATISKGVRSFTEQLERIGEVIAVLLLGTIFQFKFFNNSDLWIIPVLFFVIRPLSVYLGLFGFHMGTDRKPLIAWFGIRGIGSIYYLAFALTHGLEGDLAQRIAVITYCTIVTSIFVHGFSGLPFMNIYKKRHRSPEAAKYLAVNH